MVAKIAWQLVNGQRFFKKANFLKEFHICPLSQKWQLAAIGPVLLLELGKKLYESSSIVPKKHAKQQTKTWGPHFHHFWTLLHMAILQIHFLSHIFLSMLAMKTIEAFSRSFFDANGQKDRLTACEWSKISQKNNFFQKIPYLSVISKMATSRHRPRITLRAWGKALRVIINSTEKACETTDKDMRTSFSPFLNIFAYGNLANLLPPPYLFIYACNENNRCILEKLFWWRWSKRSPDGLWMVKNSSKSKFSQKIPYLSVISKMATSRHRPRITLRA